MDGIDFVVLGPGVCAGVPPNLSLREGVRVADWGVCGCELLDALMFDRLNFRFSLGRGGGGSMAQVYEGMCWSQCLVCAQV